MKPFEQTVRALTAFFAALVGFGLKNILEHGIENKAFVILPFLIAVSMGLRFILGSTNQMYLDYVLPKHPPIVGLLWETLSLVLFGGLCAMMCFADTLETFFAFVGGIPFVAIVWGLVAARVEQVRAGGEAKYVWSEWMVMDALQALLFVGLIALCGLQGWPQRKEVCLVIASALCVLFFIWDLHFQYCNLWNVALDEEAKAEAAKAEAAKGKTPPPEPPPEKAKSFLRRVFPSIWS